uniref:Uncharacterized protein n=1 Tax=Setaria digitata TaxID=48799 RepID=A0A915Q6M9_9BILA
MFSVGGAGVEGCELNPVKTSYRVFETGDGRAPCTENAGTLLISPPPPPPPPSPSPQPQPQSQPPSQAFITGKKGKEQEGEQRVPKKKSFPLEQKSSVETRKEKFTNAFINGSGTLLRSPINDDLL